MLLRLIGAAESVALLSISGAEFLQAAVALVGGPVSPEAPDSVQRCSGYRGVQNSRPHHIAVDCSADRRASAWSSKLAPSARRPRLFLRIHIKFGRLRLPRRFLSSR